ncbi:hypothetical protein PYCC9005_000471 [Savitreella phatthalungensis]
MARNFPAAAEAMEIDSVPTPLPSIIPSATGSSTSSVHTVNSGAVTPPAIRSLRDGKSAATSLGGEEVPTPAPSPTPTDASAKPSWSNMSPTEDQHLRDARIHFSRLDIDGRQRFLTEILNMCTPYELMAISAYVSPRLKKDFLKCLPTELALRTLSYIHEPKTLARAAQVSKHWHALLNDDLTWKRLCAVHRYRRLSSVEGDEDNAEDERPVFREAGSVRRDAMHATEDSPYFSAPAGIDVMSDQSNEAIERQASVRRAAAGSRRPIPQSYKTHFKQRYLIDANWRTGGTILARHVTDDVATVTWSCLTSDYIIVALDNSRIYVFSRDGRFLKTLDGHASGVWNLDIEGNTMCSGGCDKIVRVWDLRTGKTVHQLFGHTSTVRCLEIARLPDQHIVVTGSRDNNLRTWDYEQGMCRHVLVGHTGAVRCIKVHGEQVVSGSYDMTCKLWSLTEGTCLRTFGGHSAQIYSIAFNGDVVASGSLDSTVRVWEAQTGVSRGKLTGHTSLVGQLQMRYPLAVSGGPDGTVRVWDLEQMRCVHYLYGHENSVTTLQFDDTRIVSGSSDGLTKVWDLQSGQLVRKLSEPAEQVWRVDFDDDTAIIMSKRDLKTCLEVISFFPTEEEMRGDKSDPQPVPFTPLDLNLPRLSTR